MFLKSDLSLKLEISLVHVLFSDILPSSLLGDPEELMFQYFKKFGDKPCCFTDLKVFVDLLPATQCTKVSRVLLVTCIYCN